MDLKALDLFTELIESDNFRKLFANTDSTVMREDFLVQCLLEVFPWQNLLCNTQ